MSTKMTQRELLSENQQAELEEEINELKQRMKEDEMIGSLLETSEEKLSAKKKLRELKRLLSDAEKKVEKAECLLKEVICDREEENRKIEDAILLSDGVMKVQEKETESED